MDTFNKDGRMIVPFSKRGKGKKEDDERVRYVITEAYCLNGCSIMDQEHKINGYPALQIKYRRPGVEGLFVISAIEGDFEKIIISGDLIDGVKYYLYCPHCGTLFAKLINCNCSMDADMVAIGLTPELDFNNAITFCNVTGCKNGSFVKSGEVLRHIRLESFYNSSTLR